MFSFLSENFDITSASISVIGGSLLLYIFKKLWGGSTIIKRDKSSININTNQKKIDSEKLDPLNNLHYWYPVATSEIVTSKKPYAFKLWGEPMVLYRDSQGVVQCVNDVCPHRSAPLSIGKMVEGRLECHYHGWQFGSNGQCEHIPSVSENSKLPSMICATTRPVHEEIGLIWVWPGEAELAQTSTIPRSLFGESYGNNEFGSSTHCRSVPVEAGLMIDNLTDYAHVPFTHDGSIGKRSRATFIRMKEANTNLVEEFQPMSMAYYATEPERTTPKTTPDPSFTFIAPCFVRLDHNFGDNKIFIQVFCIVPETPTSHKYIHRFYRNFFVGRATNLIPFLNTIERRFANKVLEEDLVLLTGVLSNVRENSAPLLNRIVQADILIKKQNEMRKKMTDHKDPWFKGWKPSKLPDIEDLA